MPVVQNIARDAAGNPSRATVVIRLIAGDVADVNTPGYTTDGTVIGTNKIHTDDDGFWSIDLDPNTDYLPVGTYYEIGERPAGTRLTFVHYAEVPDEPGPLDLVGILVEPTSEPDSLYLLATQKGAAGGLATLDADGQVPADQLGNASGGGGGGGAVASVFGRTGAVTAQSGDYTKAQVGLANVDNTSDASKPVSTAQAAADTAVANAAAAALASHASDTTNVHGITDTSALVPLTWVNAQEHGAAGNGSTDDTAALQAAIDAVPAGGGVLYLPAGQYLISDPLIGKANLTIIGDGHPASIIVQQDTAANGLTFIDCNNVTLKGFRLQGPASGTGVGISAGVSATGAAFRHVYEGLYVREFGSHGIDGDHMAQTTLTSVTAESNGGHGFNFHGTALATAGTSVTCSGCYANSNGQAGFRLFKMVYSALVGCAADHSGIGYLIDTCQSVDVGGSGAEYPQDKGASYPGLGFKVTGGSRGVVLSATWVNHSIGTGWYVTGSSTGVVVLGAHENEPEVTAQYAVQVDTGCQVVVTPVGSTDGAYAPRPNNFAAGTTVVVQSGTSATTFAAGNDSRLSDARTPTAHASSHASAGADPVTLAQSQVTGLVAALAAKQDADADLTAIAGLTATTDNVIQSVAGAWASRTPAQLKSTLSLTKADVGLSNVDNTSDAAKPVSAATQTALDNKQPLDSDLTTIAGLTATTDNIIQSVAGAWASRTPTQVKAALAIAQSDVTGLTSALSAKADLASPTFTGTPSLPTGTTAVTQTSSNNTTAVATTAFVQTAAGLLVPKSLVDAKGDLLVGTANDTVARLAVGTDGQILTADSTQAGGIKWATASGGGTDYKTGSGAWSGKWYRGNFGPVGANLTLVLNRLYAAPFRLATSGTADRIGIDVATAAAAGGVARLVIYSPDGTGGMPGTVVLDAGTVAIDTTGAKQITISQALSAGFYWLAVIGQTATGAAIRATVSYDPMVPYFSGASMFTGATAPGGLASTGTSYTGAPGNNPTIADNDNCPIIGLRFA